MYTTINIGDSVIYDPVSVFLSKSAIGRERIGVESRSCFNVLADFALYRLHLTVGDNDSLHLAASLQKSHDGSLILATSPSDAPLALADVHVAGLATNEGFVGFDFSPELATEPFVLHRQTDAVKHEPRRLLRDLHIPRNLIAGDSILAVGQHPSRHKPLIKPDGGVFHHGSDLDGEFTLRMMAGASPSPAMRPVAHVLIAAVRALHNSIRPTLRDKVSNTVIGVGKVYDRFLKALRFVAHGALHELNSRLSKWWSQGNYCPNQSIGSFLSLNWREMAMTKPPCSAKPLNSPHSIYLDFRLLLLGSLLGMFPATLSAQSGPQPSVATTLSFGAISFGNSMTLTLPVMNTGSAPLTVAPSLNGPSYRVVGWQPTSCLGGTPPGQTCALMVDFSPVAVGYHEDILTLQTNGTSNPAVQMKGEATGVGIEQEAPLDFGAIPFGTTKDSPVGSQQPWRFEFGHR